jgi:hypothetical protein
MALLSFAGCKDVATEMVSLSKPEEGNGNRREQQVVFGDVLL